MSASEGDIQHRGNPPRAGIAGGPPIWAVVRLIERYPPEHQAAYVARDWAVSKAQAGAALAYYQEHGAEIQADIQQVKDSARQPPVEASGSEASAPKTAEPPSDEALRKHIVHRSRPARAVIAGGPPVWAVIYISDQDLRDLPPEHKAASIARSWAVSEEQATAALAYHKRHGAEIGADTDIFTGQLSRLGRRRAALTRAAHRHYDSLWAAARLLVLLADLLVAWVLFALAHGALPVGPTFLGAGIAVACSFVLLFQFFLRPDAKLPNWSVFAAFTLAIAALVGAYAAASLVASHMPFGLKQTHDCYRIGMDPAPLHGLDAVYVALGTLTTAGAGEIAAHRSVCRGLTVGQLSIGLAMLGLTVTGVGARLFSGSSRPRTS